MTRPTSRFDAQNFERVTACPETGRIEIQFRDAEGTLQVVSLPASEAVDLGCLICDIAEATPFLGAQPRRPRHSLRSRSNG